MSSMQGRTELSCWVGLSRLLDLAVAWEALQRGLFSDGYPCGCTGMQRFAVNYLDDIAKRVTKKIKLSCAQR